jgi:Ca2+-binding RTX toxin-like protein
MNFQAQLLPQNFAIKGGAGNDSLVGTSGDDTLDGGLGADTMAGGLGNDTYIVDNAADLVVESAGQGSDTILSSVTYAAPLNVENLTLTGNANINATGNSLNNVITGNAGSNILNGDAGVDTLIGGLGDDTYIVNHTKDVVLEAANQGTDTVRSYANYTLGAHVENLTLLGASNWSGTGNSLDNVITGNVGDNILSGGDGNDSLLGGHGSDSLDGGAGNDYFRVDELESDTIDGGTGFDSLYADYSTSYGALKLTLGATVPGHMQVVDVEDLDFRLGSHTDYLSVGASASRLYADGGGGNDTLLGGSGNDTLLGGGGGDSLSGGLGSDSLSGGAGRDTLRVSDQTSDTIDGGSDSDRLYANYSNSTVALNLTLGTKVAGNTQVTNVESAVFHLGSASDYLSVGASGTKLDYVNCGGGDDTVVGGKASERLYGGVGNDSLLGAGGKDSLYGDDGNDALFGGRGDDSLVGGMGSDALYGGAGNDRLSVFDQLSDTIDGGTGFDSLYADYSVDSVALNLTLGTTAAGNTQVTNVEYADFKLGSASDYLSVGASGALLNADGGAGNDTLIGGQNNDDLDGGVGNDSLSGGAGNDFLSVSDQSSDTIDGGSGLDVLFADYRTSNAALNLTLGATEENGPQITNVEAFNFRLGSASDFLSVGASGAQLSYVDCGGGDDTVIGGNGGAQFYGGAGNDSLLAGGGNDTLDGGAGNDALFGGAGNDSFTANEQSTDIIDGGSGWDSLNANYYSSTVALNLTMGATVAGTNQVINVESAYFQLGHADDYLSVGSSGTTVNICGGDGNDTLIGGDGNDTLTGENGNDWIVGGAGDDRIWCDGFDTVVLNSLVGSDVLSSFYSKYNKVVISASSLPVGDGDTLVEGPATQAVPGGFDASSELVIFSSDISGSITPDAAAAKIGSANGAYSISQTALFVVDNGQYSALYYFKSADNDAVVSSSELTLLASLFGSPTTVVSDYVFGA